ncbi:MAG: DUF2490 domain-containing protein [Bacteroides sp.]|nr:DUF2490 domain-containing protein [Bacteroides sp.]
MACRKILMLVSLLSLVTNIYAQDDDWGIWTSVEARKKIFPGFDASLEGEFRTRDGMKNVDRWSGGIEVAYRFFAGLKADAGYTYINSRQPGETTKKLNYIPAYWSPRHRLHLSLTGKMELRRFELSLREQYQYTYRTSLSVPKYDGDDGSRKEDEEISGKCKNVLRSRIQLDWNIRKSKFSPYASCEFYHSLTDDWVLDKTRWTAGTNYNINKQHSLDLFYRYQNHADDDEQNGHVFGIGYTYKFK